MPINCEHRELSCEPHFDPQCEPTDQPTGEPSVLKLPGQRADATRRYWTYLRLEGSDRLQICEVEAARAFLVHLLIQSELPEPCSDRALQQQLVQQMQSDSSEATQLARACLRCFISHQIQQVCQGLEQRFGEQAGFKRSDLYPCLLDDPDPMADLAPYQPLSLRILRQFDPQQSSLSTWTKRLVGQDKELNRLLLENYGLYLATDWSILLQATPARLRRLLAQRLMPDELSQFCQLLESYHRIYRGDRLMRRLGGSRCGEPTPEQLWRMLEDLESSGSLPPSFSDPQSLLKKLRRLAAHLRQFKAKPLSLSIDSIQRLADRPVDRASEAEQTQDKFLNTYRQVAQVCLRRAVDQVIAERVAHLSRRRSGDRPKHQAYLEAMRLFHAQGQSMTEIAPQVGLTRQYQVSRLLELPELQADLHQRWLLLICVELPGLLLEILEPEQWVALQQELVTFVDRLKQAKAAEAAKLTAAQWLPDQWRDHLRQISADLPRVAPLGALIDRLLEDYRAEVYSPNRLGSTSQIAICICQSLSASC